MQPVDSLAPARSALRAFGFAKFLSRFPNRSSQGCWLFNPSPGVAPTSFVATPGWLPQPRWGKAALARTAVRPFLLNTRRATRRDAPETGAPIIAHFKRNTGVFEFHRIAADGW